MDRVCRVALRGTISVEDSNCVVCTFYLLMPCLIFLFIFVIVVASFVRYMSHLFIVGEIYGKLVEEQIFSLAQVSKLVMIYCNCRCHTSLFVSTTDHSDNQILDRSGIIIAYLLS